MKWSKQVIVAIWISCLLLVSLPLSGAVFAAVPMLAITEANILNGGVTVSGTLSEAGSAQLLVAAYTADGKMTDVKDVTQDAADGSWSITLDFPSGTLNCVKAFLLDNNTNGCKPLLTAEEMITSGMLLTIDTAGSYNGSYANVTILESALTAPVTLLDMYISGNLTIAGGIAPQSLGLLTVANQAVSLTGSTTVAGKVVLNRQGVSAEPLQLILEEQAHIQSAEVLGSAGAVIVSLTESENTINNITAGQNLQLINTKVGQLTAQAGDLQALQVGLYQSEVQNLTVAPATEAAVGSATLGKQVSTFAAAETLFDDLRTARISTGETLYLNTENKINLIDSSQTLQLQRITEIGTVTMTAALQADAGTSITALTTNADAVIAGRLQSAQVNAAALDSAPNLTLLGSGITTLSGKIKKLTLGGEATAILAASENGENEIGSVEMQTSEPAMQSLSLNLLALSASSGPSFTVMSGSGVGGILTSGSGNLGGISILNGTGSFVPIHLGPGVFAQFVQFGNNSAGQLTLGGTDNLNGQLGSLINNSPLPSQLLLPTGSSQNSLIGNVFDSNNSSGLQMRIGEGDATAPASSNDLVFVGMNIVELPRKTTYKVNETMDYSGMMVELVYMPGTSSVIRTPITRYEEVKGNQNFRTDMPLLNSASSYTLRVTHQESQQSVEFLINVVNAYEVEKIRIVQYPTKLTYQIGNPLDLNGGILAVAYQGIAREQTVPMMTDGHLTDGLVAIGFNSNLATPQRVQLIFGRRAIVDLDVVVGGKSTLENYRTDALNFIAAAELNEGNYSGSEWTVYHSTLNAMKTFINAAVTPEQISGAWQTAERTIRSLRTNADKQEFELRLAIQSGIGEISSYWPVNQATGLKYGVADYTSTMLLKIVSIRAVWSRSLGEAVTVAEINGDGEHLGLLQEAKVLIDAVPCANDSLDAVLAAVSDFSLEVKAGATAAEKMKLVKEVVSRQIINAGGNPLWGVTITDSVSGGYTVQIADGIGHTSNEKTITVTFTASETRGSLAMVLANSLQGKFGYLPLDSSAVIAEMANFVETINMTAEQRSAFAFLYHYRLINGRGQIGNQQRMEPNAAINRADLVYLLTDLEEAVGVHLRETVTIEGITDLNSSDPLYQKALHLANAGVITLGTENTLNPNGLISAASGECLSAVNALTAGLSSVIASAGTYAQFQIALTDALVQKVVTAGDFAITANDTLNKQLLISAGTTLTIAESIGYTIDNSQSTVWGTLINNGSIQVTVNGSLSFMNGSVLTNNSNLDVYGRAVFESGSAINGSKPNITYHHNANLLDAAQQIYQQLKEGYRLDLPVQTDINEYAGVYADWSSIPKSSNPNDQTENTMAIAFLLKNGIITGVAGLGDDVLKKYIQPFATLSRAETAMLLIKLETVLIGKQTITGLDQTIVPNPVFNDLNGTEEYYQAVLRLAKAGVIQGDTGGNFNPNAAMDATWYDWGSQLSDLVHRFVMALGQITSTQQSFTVLRNGEQVIENKKFTNTVNITCGTPVNPNDDYGGSIRFSNCTFAAGLTAEVGLVRYDIDLGRSVVTGGIQVSRSDANNKFQQNVNVNLNNVANGTEIRSDAATAVNCGIEAGSFVINGITVRGSAVLGEKKSFGAYLKWECYSFHPEQYQGDHSACSGSQFTALAFYDAVETVEVSASAVFGNYEMWDNSSDISLNFPADGVAVSMDRLRINNRNQKFGKTLTLSGQVSADVEISGKVDLSALLNPNHQIYLAAWNNGNQIAIGSLTVTVNGQSTDPTLIQAESGATVIVEQSMQDVAVSYTANNTFSLGGPHVFGDVGNYGVYLMGAPLQTCTYLLEQRTMNGELPVAIKYITDYQPAENKTHLIPDPESQITDPFAVRLTVHWQPDANTDITIVWPNLYYKQPALNRRDLAMQLYTALSEGYGLASVDTTAIPSEVETLLSGFEDRAQLANDGEGSEALAFLLKNVILNPAAGTNLLPYNDLTRSETAVILYQSIIALNRLSSLDQSVNISFHDVTDGQALNDMAIMTLARAGVVSGDNQGNFYPDERMLSNQTNELIIRFVNALGPATSTQTSFIVRPDQEQTVTNKIFSSGTPVVITSADWESDAGGGQITFVNCQFNGGLQAYLGEVRYNLNFAGTTSVKDNLIKVDAAASNAAYQFNGRVNLQINGLPESIAVESSVTTGIASNLAGGSITLNGFKVFGADQIGESEWFGANLNWECNGYHEPGYFGNHEECIKNPGSSPAETEPADHYLAFAINGKVKSVSVLQAGTPPTLTDICSFRVSEQSQDVTLSLGTLQPSKTFFNLNGNSSRLLTVSGTILTAETVVCGKVDITALQHPNGPILIGAWQENTAVAIGSQMVTIIGYNNIPVALTALLGAIVNLEQPNQTVSINASDPDGGFLLGRPVVFDTEIGYGINLDRLYTSAEYRFELWQYYFDDSSMQPLPEEITFTQATASDGLSTYLLPTSQIRNPYQVELTIERTTSAGTISVIWWQLEYKQAPVTLSGAAKLIHQAFRQDYRLAEPNSDELTAYAAYADWCLMEADADAQAAMAFLLCYQIITATAGSGEDANKHFVDPYRSLNRSDAAILVYNLGEQLRIVEVLKNGWPQNVEPGISFYDVISTDPFYTAVMTLTKAGLIGGGDGHFNPAGEISADDLARLITSLQSIIGPIPSSQASFIVSKNQSQTVQSKTFSNPVIVTCEPGQSGDWGGEIRFTDCHFNSGLTLKLGDRSFAVNLDGVTILSQTVNAVLDESIKPAPVQLNSPLRIDINGIENGMTVNSTVNVNAACKTANTYFTLNGVKITKAATAPANDPFGAQIMWECNGDHAENYIGDHTNCVKDRNNPRSELAKHYLSMLLWGKTGSAEVVATQSGTNGIYRYEMTKDCTCASLSLGSIEPAIGYLFLTSSTTANCAVSGTVTGDLVVIGNYDISAVNVTGSVLLSASWAGDSLTTIGAKEVTIVNYGNVTIGINAGNGARIIVEQPDQYFVINQTETETGFAIDAPHVFGNAGDYGVYIGTANATEYAYTVEQILYDENHPDGYWQPLTVTPEYFADKTHLNPSVSTPITNPYNVRLTVTWTKNNQVITVVYAWLNYLPPAVNRVDVASQIYAAFQDGYGLAAPTQEEIASYSLSYSADWTAMSADKQAAMAFLLKHGLISGTANEIKPYNMLTRAEIAAILDQLDAKLAHHLTGNFTVPNFSDLVGTEPYYAAVIKMVETGVITDYEGTVFAPNNGVPDGLMREYLRNFVSALEPYSQVESGINSFVVSPDFDQVINNKNFTMPVTVTCSTPFDPTADYSWGGNLTFNNCSFSAGLTLILNTISFDVDLRGAYVPGGISLQAGTSLNPLDGDKSITLYSLCNGTTVTSAVNCMIENYCVGDWYTLNLVKVQSIPPTGNEVDYHFGSNIYWNCGVDHPKDYTGEHSECATADRFVAFAIFGNVQTLTVPAVAAFQRYEMWYCPADVSLVFETPGVAVPYLVIIGGDNERCLSDFLVSGVVDSDVTIIRNVNAANLTVTDGHTITHDPDLDGRVDKSALDNALRAADSVLSSLRPSENGTDVPDSSFWVSFSAYEAYQDIFDEAMAVITNDNATQTEVENAANALISATNTINIQKQQGTLVGPPV
ncbi:MAG: S-layer homology domain-containing protein [Negativicutes bacterium]|nr:S-layer homology domain-containing protein [Negativicutes bacterium]